MSGQGIHQTLKDLKTLQDAGNHAETVEAAEKALGVGLKPD